MRVTNGTRNDILERISSSLSYSTGEQRRYSPALVFTSLLRLCNKIRRCSTCAGYLNPLPIVPRLREYLESEISSKSRNPIANVKVSPAQRGNHPLRAKDLFVLRTSASQKNLPSSVPDNITVK